MHGMENVKPHSSVSTL